MIVRIPSHSPAEVRPLRQWLAFAVLAALPPLLALLVAAEMPTLPHASASSATMAAAETAGATWSSARGQADALDDEQPPTF